MYFIGPITKLLKIELEYFKIAFVWASNVSVSKYICNQNVRVYGCKSKNDGYGRWWNVISEIRLQ
jgi:hypothetical protein